MQPRILFVCVENANRSQMAEAFAKIHGSGEVLAMSAGSRPAPSVNPQAVAAMKERGYDLSTHRPKSVHEIPEGPYDFVITMGCQDDCPAIPARHREDWPLMDPKDLPQEDVSRIRNEIEGRVLELLRRIGEALRREG